MESTNNIMYLVLLITSNTVCGFSDADSIEDGLLYNIEGLFSNLEKATEYADSCNRCIEEWKKDYFRYVISPFNIDPEFDEKKVPVDLRRRK